MAGYLFMALFYAMFVAVLVLGFRAAWTDRQIAPAGAALTVAVLFMVFLGLHPFPSPDAVACKRVILDPRDATEPFMRLWQTEAPLAVWLRDTGVVSMPVNFGVCTLIGALLALRTGRLRAALALGTGMSGFIEISQLTGLYGLYPCPYRHFDTADLLLNIGGVIAGFAAMRRLGRAQAKRS